MKKIAFVVAVIALVGCTTRKEKIAKEQVGNRADIELNGHDYWLPTVGIVSGQSNGSISQLVHNPDCHKCQMQSDSLISSVIREELRNFGEEVE